MVNRPRPVTDATRGITRAAVSVAAGQLFGSDSVGGGTTVFSSKDVSRNGSGVVQSDKSLTLSGVTVSDGNGGNNYTVGYAANTASRILLSGMWFATEVY